MGAAAFSTPELVLDPKEAETLAHAIAAVQAYYPVVIDPKTLAWGNLVMVVGTIYGTRALAIWARKSQPAPKPHKADNVTHLKGGGAIDPMQFQAGKMPPLN